MGNFLSELGKTRWGVQWGSDNFREWHLTKLNPHIGYRKLPDVRCDVNQRYRGGFQREQATTDMYVRKHTKIVGAQHWETNARFRPSTQSKMYHTNKRRAFEPSAQNVLRPTRLDDATTHKRQRSLRQRGAQHVRRGQQNITRRRNVADDASNRREQQLLGDCSHHTQRSGDKNKRRHCTEHQQEGGTKRCRRRRTMQAQKMYISENQTTKTIRGRIHPFLCVFFLISLFPATTPPPRTETHLMRFVDDINLSLA